MISKLETSFHPGFSVMTGETGAGKSIILGALSLILGQRADLQSVKDKSKKCVIEGEFDAISQNFEAFFEDHNLDFDPQLTILRREILPSGKSRAFINDTPVSLAQLKEIAFQLVDIHSQNSTILLQDSAFQLDVLDSFCANGENLKTYKKLYKKYKALESELESLRKAEAQARIEQDFCQYQFDEIENANLQIDEQQNIESELKILNHAEEIKTRIYNASALLAGEHGLNQLFNHVLSEIKPLQKFSQALLQLFERIESNFLEMTDVAYELDKMHESVEVNPRQTEMLNERLNLIYNLQHKHRVSDVAELIKIKNEYGQKINDFSSLNKNIAATAKQLEAVYAELKDSAKGLSKKRIGANRKLENQVIKIVSQLGMPNAKIKIDIQKTQNLTASGNDSVVFLFNANQGGELLELSKVASGGEHSRLMLAIKSQIAAKNLVSTIIFDEIDSGISGEVAGKMAGIMQEMSHEIQVISITHLPQIAARGKYHYLVQKDSDDKSTTTTIKQLSKDERVTEIAKMLSDSKISDSALATASELINN